jgi:hypothetical protein
MLAGGCGFFGGEGDQVENLGAVAPVPIEGGGVLCAEKRFRLVEARCGFQFADQGEGGWRCLSRGQGIAAKPFGVLDAFEVGNRGLGE